MSDKRIKSKERNDLGVKTEICVLNALNELDETKSWVIIHRDINIRYGIIIDGVKISVGDCDSLFQKWIESYKNNESLTIFVDEDHPEFNLLKYDITNGKIFIEVKSCDSLSSATFCEFFGPHTSKDAQQAYLDRKGIDRDIYGSFCIILQKVLNDYGISDKILEANKDVKKYLVSNGFAHDTEVGLTKVTIAKERVTGKGPLRRLEIKYVPVKTISTISIGEFEYVEVIDKPIKDKKQSNIQTKLFGDIYGPFIFDIRDERGTDNWVGSIESFVKNIQIQDLDKKLIDSGVLCTEENKTSICIKENRYKSIFVNGTELFANTKGSKKDRRKITDKFQNLLN